MTRPSRKKNRRGEKQLNLVGIDEAGRGPLAGPVAVGAVLLPRGFDAALLCGVRDSKQLTPRAREEWYAQMLTWRRGGFLSFSVALVGAAHIDRAGIVSAINLALRRSLARLSADPESSRILLDGGLRAPAHYEYQETIIRGDESEEVIALASIAAKVVRDRHMRRLSLMHPEYDFSVHKGYGTAAHYRALKKHGISPVHRRSFLRSPRGS